MNSYALDPDRALNEYNNNKWGVDEQLPQVYVTAIAQDSKGYIWIGTQSGMARFNGKEFVHFDRSNTKALKSNVINDLLIDEQDNLWILTDSGLTLLNDQGFISLDDQPLQSVKPHQLLKYEDQLLISTSNGLFKIVNNTILPYIISSESYALDTSSRGLLIGGRGQISFIQNGIVTNKLLPTAFSKAIINDIQVVNEEIWLATSMGLLIYRAGEFTQLEGVTRLVYEPTNALYLDENQILWVASNRATYRLNGHTLHNSNEKNSYPNVSKFLRDSEGSLWIGTRDSGLFQLWNSWSVRYGKYHGIKESLIWSVAGDSLSNLIVGSDSGVYKFEDARFKSLIGIQQLPNPSAYTLFIDGDQTIWVGTKGGIAHFDQQGIKIDNALFDQLLGLQINAIFRDSRDALWILTEQGVYRKSFDKTEENLRQVIEHIGIGTVFEQSTFRAITELDDIIYLGSHSGLLSFEEKNGLVADNDNRLKTFVTSLDEYQGRLIVGTYSSGLFIKDKNKWVNLRKKDGLVFDSSFSLNQLDGSLWVSGFDGVYRLSFKSIDDFISNEQTILSAEPILKDSGYIAGSQKAYCCNGAGHAKSTLIGGDLWLPTRRGVLKLEPDKVIKNKRLVTTVIETIGRSQYLFDMYFEHSKDSTSGLIKFDERDIDITFIGLTSYDEGLVKYRYKLQGYSDKWINNDSHRKVSYTNLPHGKYIFEVIASNNNGLWANQSTQQAFTINPRYYETNYFKLFLILVLLLLLFGLYKLAIYRNRMKVERLEAKISDKTKALVIANNQLAEANERLSIYSYTDSLTGAYNRRYLDKQIKSDISHYVRLYQQSEKEQNILFLMVDIDYFKDVNDCYGHQSGDEVLKQVVECLQSNIRDGDYLVRWGGEEFLIVLRPEHVFSVEEMCSRLLLKIADTDFAVAPEQLIKLTISLGYCFYPLSKRVVDNWCWRDALGVADKALYRAKSNGRNQWVGYQLLPGIIENFGNQNNSSLGSDSFQRFSGSDSS